MKFLTIEDLTSKLKSNIIADTLQITNSSIITENNPTLVQIEADQIELMKSYLSNKYDTNFIFNQEGTKRNRVLINILSDLLIYELLVRLASDVVPEVREQKYERCLTMLKQIRDGILTLDIVEKNINYDNSSQLIWSSDIKNHTDW